MRVPANEAASVPPLTRASADHGEPRVGVVRAAALRLRKGAYVGVLRLGDGGVRGPAAADHRLPRGGSERMPGPLGQGSSRAS